MGAIKRGKIIVPREVLLVEVERRCRVGGCAAKNRVGLTKAEAYAYQGFECERCERWNDDHLTERDVPEWWEELTVTGLRGLRGGENTEEFVPGETVLRLSDDYRRLVRPQIPSRADGDEF